MRVENIHRGSHDGRPAIVATVIWENTARENQEIYFATLDRFAHYLNPGAAPYAAGCIFPALRHGEKRLLIDSPLCPELRDGLETVMAYMRLWYAPDEPRLSIEAEVEKHPRPIDSPGRAALFFSGGIDSLALLRDNHHRYPKSHPEYYRDGILIYGQNVESDNRPETFEATRSALSEVTDDANISLLPVYTNLRSLDESTSFFIEKFHGAILGAVSHAVSGRLHSVSISASDSVPGLALLNQTMFKRFGSHPLTDPNYSSYNLRVRHVGLTHGRLAKTEIVARWPVALQNIRVCQPNWPGDNCGRCEKCLRTMLALTAVGALDKTRSFPIDYLTVDHVKNLKIKPGLADDYLEMIIALHKCGRSDLAKSIDISLGRALGTPRNAWEYIRMADQKYLNGKLRYLKKRLLQMSVPKASS